MSRPVAETAIPVNRTARSAAEVLGLDLLTVANEGKLLLIIAEQHADAALAVLRSQALGRHATIIGHVVDAEVGCELRNALGGSRTLRQASGELLPRIC